MVHIKSLNISENLRPALTQLEITRIAIFDSLFASNWTNPENVGQIYTH